MDKMRREYKKILNYIKSIKMELSQREEECYIQEAVKRNAYSFRVLVSLTFVCELYNMVRVLYFSNSGLGTLNNRIYFTMYLILFLSGVLYLVLESLLKKDVKKVDKLYGMIALTWMLWHVGINYYDLSKNPLSGTSIYIVAIFTCAIFLQSKPRNSFLINAITYVIFSAATYNILDNGDRVNLLIAVMMGAVIAGRRYVYSIQSIKRDIQIHNANEQLKREQLELQMSLRKHEVIMEYTNDIIFEWDVKADTLQLSNNAQNKLYVPLMIEGVQTWFGETSDIHPEDVSNFINAISKFISQKRAGDVNVRMKERTGKYVWYQARIFMQYGSAGEVLYAIGIMTDIDRQQRQLEKLSIQSSKDPLTGVLNTKAFQQQYQQSIQELELGEMIVMFMVDLDDFKDINDIHGHVCGDYVLKGIADTLRSVFREIDFFGRLGGDEFAAMMMNVKDMEVIKVKAEQILKRVSEIRVHDKDIKVSCSVGIAMTKDVDMNYETLYNFADVALYQSKAFGKGCFHIYNNEN